jgi:glycosyltransferase involved in cell wall biosynthesis
MLIHVFLENRGTITAGEGEINPAGRKSLSGKALTFSVITPCRNAASRLAATMDAVRNQTAIESGEVELQHIVIDGASTDETADLVRSRGDDSVEFVSEADGGMYEAVSKGLQRATGHWITYLNAGDLLDSRAFETVLAVERTHDVAWITGRSVMQDDQGRLAREKVPFRYRRALILAGQYCRRAPLFLPFLQQEGTFWRRDLGKCIDFEKLSRFKLAGDYYLWRCFAAFCEPTVVAHRLGVFRRHVGQLSENRPMYHEEVTAMADPLMLPDALQGVLDALAWYTPTVVKKRFNPRQILIFHPESNTWR